MPGQEEWKPVILVTRTARAVARMGSVDTRGPGSGLVAANALVGITASAREYAPRKLQSLILCVMLFAASIDFAQLIAILFSSNAADY